MLLQTQRDVRDLSGKFVIQLNESDPDLVLSDDNWAFCKEKRISFVSGYDFVGFWYAHRTCNSWEEVVEYFNQEGKNRFFRLLTSKELEFVFRKLKEENL